MSVRLLLCTPVVFACGAAQAAGVVIYRCTDASGALTVQNDMPCPKGARQQKQVIRAPAPMPAYLPARAPVASPEPAAATTPAPAVNASAPVPGEPAAATSAAATADAQRLPPPALYRCNTFDNDRYLSEDNAPAPVRAPADA